MNTTSTEEGEPQHASNELFFAAPTDWTPGPFTSSEVDPEAQKTIDEHPLALATDFALAELPCRLIDLAAIAGTIGAARLITDPLTHQTTPVSLNVLVLSPPGSMTGAAILQSTAAVRDLVDGARRTNAEMKGPKIRARRIELEQICQGLIDQLRNPTIPPTQPFTIHPPAEIARKDQQAALLPRAEQVVGMLLEQTLIEHPDLLTDVVTAKAIENLRDSPDRALFSISPVGNALTSLLSAAPVTRQRTAQALTAAWWGRDGTASNLWVVSEAAARQAVVCEPLLSTFLVVEGGTTDADISPSTHGAWDDLLLRLLQARLRREVLTYELDEAARQEFLGFLNRTRRDLRERLDDSATAAVVWPQQLLRLAGLLHLSAGGLDQPLIDTKHVVAAVTILEQTHATQLQLRHRSDADSLERAVAFMATKVQRSGPLTRRELFRLYDCQDYARLDPVLQACVERGRIRRRDEKLVAVEAGVSVSAVLT